MSKQNVTQRGFSLVEVLLYAVMVTIVAIATISFMLSLQDVITRQKAERLISTTATVAFERILFESRQATAVDLGASTINATSGVLVLEQETDTLQFELINGTIYATENSVLLGALTPPGVTVNSFTIYHYDNGRTELMRVVAEVTADVASTTITDRLEGAVQLRGSYE